MSINIGMSGLKSTTEQMNTISHNIANVGTIGYKSSRTEFQDIYAPEFGGGQMNGVEVAATRQSFTGGTTTPTGRNSDLAINGEGFFMVQSNGQQMFTRNGVMNLDAEGYLVTADGYRLQGYDATDTGQIQNGTMKDLTVETGDMPAKTSTKVDLGLNLDANSSAIDPVAKPFDKEDPTTFTSSATTTVFDSIGGEHEVTQYFVKTGDNQWKVHYMLDDATAPTKSVDVAFDAAGKLAAIDGNSNANSVDLNLQLTNGANDLNLAFNISEVSQYGSEFSINKNAQDGYAPGKLAGWYFETDGTVYARYSNGQTKAQGQIVLARFPNQEGLQQAGGTRWTQSFASGAPLTGVAGTGQLGALRTGMYEGSNVDLTSEMVGLMSAQSNYQANAKTIQTAQEMTQILFQNL
ncbi:flagellar hook-basal body complex protein [Photobacterium sp. SDRW27]|uniref:flagellar hook protein FlgE n=1 Tax=Photobacterium obscurum TaxID=2829490 RepID=UPI002243E15C|nr:flagellar hook protein FlgE [Photobacterium obscurum]MCW8330695.1 flagellar hook-basal body complex protein [Photobacterium obscurum]